MPEYVYRGAVKNEPTIVRGRVKGRNGRVLKPCGTPSAYSRHIANRERPCAECRAARNAYDAARLGRTRTVASPGQSVCGTLGGYELHRRRKEPACFDCLAAAAAHKRAWRANRKANQEGTTR